MGSPYRVPSPPPREPTAPTELDSFIGVVLVGLVVWLVFASIRPHEPQGYDSAGGLHVSRVSQDAKGARRP